MAATIPEKSDVKVKNKEGTNVKTAEEKVVEAAKNTSELLGSYGNIVNKVKQLTGITLPGASSISVVNKAQGLLTGTTDVLSTLKSGENGSVVISDNTNPQPAAFKWVEKESVPGDFISYDSVLLFAGEALYADNAKGATFTPIGMCEGFNIGITNNVTTLQELRCEENLVFPGKSQPINISISRLCGKWTNLMNRLHNKNTDLVWNLSMQYSGYRDLFGLYVMVMDTSRQNIVTSFYIERCAITNYQLGIAAGEMRVLENCNIIGGRIVDPSHKVDTTNGNGTSTGEEVEVTGGTTAEDGENTNVNSDTNGEVSDGSGTGEGTDTGSTAGL